MRDERASIEVRPMKLGIAVLVVGFTALCAFAAQGNPANLPWGALAVTAIGSGGVGALLMLRARRRETNANADKLEADAISTSTGTIAKLITQLNDLLGQVATARADARSAEARAAQAFEQVSLLTTRLARVEEIAAIAIAANRLQDYHDFVDLFDLIPTPVIFSSPMDGGRFEWVNRAMCNALGRERHELLGTNWTNLVVEDDLGATKREEAAAHRRRVWGFRNRYRAGDGRVVTFEWYTAVYKDGGTIGFAFEVRPGEAHLTPPFAARIPIKEPTA